MPLDISEGRILLTREEAATCGLSRFWTGRTCRRGHKAERFVSNGQCVTCNAEDAKFREKSRCGADPSYRMYRSVQRRSGQVLKGRASPAAALGCDWRTLRDHIAARFAEGMTWGRYGQWEVDHIVPLSAGRDLPGLIRLCHYRNLQPLWKRDNLMKGGA